ncbi:DNA-processing protein DprA [Salibacterium halotolerans]|uniref:DNA processing protein n=1 Tax=Salibacterium halotolerans TaxID=1884432 RepID=A0A1I5N5Y9_9BACI|nr:DNA-processing protein DprA [Salibacterium halotolerans]SFP17238.1 DNA processing protein [Salibacterium halotolerans]
MFNFKNTKELKNFLYDEILIASEALIILGITSQRLHQFIKSGRIEPIKKTKAGTLYLKSEIYELKNELDHNTSGKQIIKNNTYPYLNNVSQERLIECVNYFSLYPFFNSSPKKIENFYLQYKQEIDFKIPFNEQEKNVSSLLLKDSEDIKKVYEKVLKSFHKLDSNDHIIKRGDSYYPKLLDLTEEAPRFLFMRGNINLINQHCISVVGTRNPTLDGEKKANSLASFLGKREMVVTSGLAKGIDTAAHKGALQNNFETIGVLGTPLNRYYPKENEYLQRDIGTHNLLISQFSPSSTIHRWNFPMRNGVMSGLSLATVIIEAGETSGSLIQANYAIKQGRVVFIPQSALDNSDLNWPKKYIEKDGVYTFSKISELINTLEDFYNKFNTINHQDSLFER